MSKTNFFTGVNDISPFLRIFNYADVFGGQEKFVALLLSELERRDFNFSFVGGPSQLRGSGHKNTEQELNRYRVDLINGNRALYLRGWSRTDADISVYVHHSHVQDAQGHFFKRIIRKILLYIFLRRMDIVVRVCNDSLPSWYSPGRVHTIYNGVPLPKLSEGDSVVRPFTLLMVGAVNKNKNQKLAMELLAHEKDIHLLIIGDGPDRPMLEQLARNQGMESRVRWLGFVDEPSPFYQQVDALLILSAYEAFPYAMLEAMAHSLPVVATSVGGIPEAIVHEHNGLLLPERDLPSLLTAVRQLKDNPDWRTKLGKQARKTVSEQFTADRMTNNLLAVIEATARKKGLIQ